MNFLARTTIAFLVGYFLYIALLVIFLFPLLALVASGVDDVALELSMLSLSFLIGSIIAFAVPAWRPLFTTGTSFFIRAGTILLALLIIALCHVGFWSLSSKIYELREANSAEIHTQINRKSTYLRDNKDELKRLYGEGCFVLTAQNETYALDQKYTAMNEDEQFSALMGLRLPKGAQAYCTDSLQYY